MICILNIFSRDFYFPGSLSAFPNDKIIPLGTNTSARDEKADISHTSRKIMLSISNSDIPKVSKGDWRIRLYGPLSTVPKVTDNTVGGIIYDIPPFCTIRLSRQNENMMNISLETDIDAVSSTLLAHSGVARKELITVEWDKNLIRVSYRPLSTWRLNIIDFIDNETGVSTFANATDFACTHG